METSTDMWVKPFSTGIACVDTIHGECIKNVSVEDCVDLCNKSDICAYGYHVKLPNEKDSYCLPINELPYMDNTEIFTNSLYPKTSARILSPNVGVDVTTFQNKNIRSFNQPKTTEISQLNTYLLRCYPKIKDTAHKNQRDPNDTLYLQNDLVSWSNDRNNAAQIVVTRDSIVYSAVSTRDPRLRNGNLCFLNIKNQNLLYVFINEQTNGFFPRSIRSASSITYNIADLYHTQIIKSVPFDDEPITTNDIFSIRSATIPVNDYVYYWMMDTDTNTIKYEKVSKDTLLDPNTDYDKHKRFSFEKFNSLDIYKDENFLSSQLNYLLDTFYYTKSDSRQYKLISQKNTLNTLFILMIIGAIFFIILTLILFFKR